MPRVEPIDDDDSIPHDARLWRRVFPAQAYNDEKNGRYRPESCAFRDHTEGIYGLSVYVAGETTPDEALKAAPSMYLAEFAASVARDCGCKLVRDPDDSNPAHALIFGDGQEWKLTKRQAKAIATASQFIIPDFTGPF
jgi:hypothetical protein